jgi:hypothetical protein
MLSSTRPSCLVLVHGRHLAPQLGAPCVHLCDKLGAHLGYLGESLGKLRGDVCLCALQCGPGRRHEPRDAGAEGGAQVCLQLAQQGVDHGAACQPCEVDRMSWDKETRGGENSFKEGKCERIVEGMHIWGGGN